MDTRSLSASPSHVHFSGAAAPAGFFVSVRERAGKLWTAMQNRRSVAKLDGLSEWELNDIGLTRDDLRYCRRLPYSVDPTTELAIRARSSGVMRKSPR